MKDKQRQKLKEMEKNIARDPTAIYEHDAEFSVADTLQNDLETNKSQQSFFFQSRKEESKSAISLP
jgi:hypothetical protein